MSESANNSSREYYTTGNVAELCGVSRITVLRWIEKAYLPAFRLPEGHYRIHVSDLNRFLKEYNIPNKRK